MITKVSAILWVPITIDERIPRAPRFNPHNDNKHEAKSTYSYNSICLFHAHFFLSFSVRLIHASI